VTSHDVVQTVRRTLGTRSAGHTGTLDPFATGLLIVLVGRATRLARFVEGQLKTYVATARLGVQTDTDDLTGRIVATSEPAGMDPSRVAIALAEFVGTTLQRPPDFSAKHVAGERSYQKARRGETVQLEPVSVTVTRLEMLECKLPLVTFRAEVSAGTYIRGIARDLGERLGVGAHLTSLRREAIGSLRVEDSTPLAELTAGALIPAALVLGNMATVELDPDMRVAVSHGRAVVDRGTAGQRGSGTAVALLADGELIAVASADEGLLRPTVVLSPA
jgi:tRNA pseudouridine55 synthase